MKKIVLFLCGIMMLLLIAGCHGTTASSSSTVSEQSFIGTWTGTDTGTNSTVTVIIASENPAVPSGPTTALVNLSVPNPKVPGTPFTTTPPIIVPRFVLDSAGEFNFYSASSPAGANYHFTHIYVDPIDTSGAMSFQFTIVEPDGVTNAIGPITIALNRTSST